jgi:hypothetical protein
MKPQEDYDIVAISFKARNEKSRVLLTRLFLQLQ